MSSRLRRRSIRSGREAAELKSSRSRYGKEEQQVGEKKHQEWGVEQQG